MELPPSPRSSVAGNGCRCPRSSEPRPDPAVSLAVLPFFGRRSRQLPAAAVLPLVRDEPAQRPVRVDRASASYAWAAPATRPALGPQPHRPAPPAASLCSRASWASRQSRGPARLQPRWPRGPQPPFGPHRCQLQHRSAKAQLASSFGPAAALHGPKAARSFESVRSVRIRSTTLARLLHGFVLLPSGISDSYNNSCRYR